MCEPGPAQIRVLIEDEKAKGVPGVDVWVTWEGGADRFVTGLKPEKGPGYGDFDVQPGIAYDVAGGRLFVTGKLWPKLFEVQLVPKRAR